MLCIDNHKPEHQPPTLSHKPACPVTWATAESGVQNRPGGEGSVSSLPVLELFSPWLQSLAAEEHNRKSCVHLLLWSQHAWRLALRQGQRSSLSGWRLPFHSAESHDVKTQFERCFSWAWAENYDKLLQTLWKLTGLEHSLCKCAMVTKLSAKIP